jgi:hypothetical protein
MKNKILIIIRTNTKTDFNQAKVEAMGQNKPLFWFFLVRLCIKLDKTIWQSEAFKDMLLANYILQRDFPKKSIARRVKETKSAEKYNQEGFFLW